MLSSRSVKTTFRRALSHFAASSSSSESNSMTTLHHNFPSRHLVVHKGFFRETASQTSSSRGNEDTDEDGFISNGDVFAENAKGDPVYFGRKNKSQLKRDANRHKNLANQLLASPKTLKKLPGLVSLNNERLLEGLLECQKTTSHIAKKRAEQLVAKQLRGLEEEELKPLEEVVERVKLGAEGGLALAVDPRADDLARDWRKRITMVAKSVEEEDAFGVSRKEALEEVFQVMQRVESEMKTVSFTRQELVDVARKAETEAKETAKNSEEFTDRQRREAMGEIVFIDDVDEEVEEVFLLKKSKGNTIAKNGSKKKKKMKGKKSSMKGLLKMLRDVAEHAV